MRTPFLLAALCFFALSADTALTRTEELVSLPVTFIGETCEETRAPLSAITWNVALAPGMNPMYSERRAPIAFALQKLEYDVLCAQEAWLDRDKRVLLAASDLPYENVFIHDTAGLGEDEEDTCKNTPLDALLECVSDRCADRVKEDTALCAIAECRGPLNKIFLRDRRCINCLASQVGNGVEEIGNACVHSSASRVYGGRNGVMLFSRLPLHNREVIMLPSSNANRPVLFARVHPPGLPQSVEIACGHIASPQPISPFHSGALTWEEEQGMQVRIVHEKLVARADGRPMIFMGDMNFGGVNGKTVVEYSRSALDDLLALGWRDGAAEFTPFCSVCKGNTVRLASNGPGLLLDHIFSRGDALRPLCADRLLDHKVSVKDRDDQMRSTHLSDHYAVRVKFGFK